MQDMTAPGDIPEWQMKLKGLTATSRQRLALYIGVSDRTLLYWRSGKHQPRVGDAQRILKWIGKA